MATISSFHRRKTHGRKLLHHKKKKKEKKKRKEKRDNDDQIKEEKGSPAQNRSISPTCAVDPSSSSAIVVDAPRTRAAANPPSFHARALIKTPAAALSSALERSCRRFPINVAVPLIDPHNPAVVDSHQPSPCISVPLPLAAGSVNEKMKKESRMGSGKKSQYGEEK
ncbi:hypothetical protein M0R45_026247 [Rubus argutus]|uniref:Uncharacterized protein n=1 Tax=Rubus argutus TaxID=59490 RepID=A0AAW1WWF3_RUBAR